MSSNLKVNTILPSTGTAIGIGTASGNVDVLGHIVGHNTPNISGINSVTATTFYGSGANLTSLPAANLTGTLPAISGANLTSLPAQATIANNADNRVITGGSGVNLNGEANLTFNGTLLHAKGSGEILRLETTASGGGQCFIDFDDETATRASIGMRGSSSDTLTLAALNGSMRFDVQNKTQALNITSNGQLLIGTTTAVRALTIKDPGQIHVESTSTGNWVGMSIKGSSGTNNYNAYFGVLDSNGKFFIDNSSNGADIEIESGASGQKAGRVLVGPSVPTSGDDSQMIIRNNPSNGIYRCLRLNNDSNNNRITMTFEGNGTATGDIRLNGSTTSYNSYSDYRLKENVVPLTDPVTRLKTLKPYRFNFIASPDITLDGFFAHEVSPAVAEAVGGEKDDVDNDGNVIPQALDMAKLVPLLTASLQEAFTKIEALEAEVAVLKSS